MRAISAVAAALAITAGSAHAAPMAAPVVWTADWYRSIPIFPVQPKCVRTTWDPAATKRAMRRLDPHVDLRTEVWTRPDGHVVYYEWSKLRVGTVRIVVSADSEQMCMILYSKMRETVMEQIANDKAVDERIR